LNIISPQPVSVHFQHFLEYLVIPLLHIIPSRLFGFPSWSLILLTCDLWLIRNLRGKSCP
jgi:sterol desaturase/sphingolipid hydroxylase (fatty acid hydroxylase superfamily)